MLEELSLTEIEGQHLELLPARTVMSMFMTEADGATTGGTGSSTPPNPFAFMKDMPLIGKLFA